MNFLPVVLLELPGPGRGETNCLTDLADFPWGSSSSSSPSLPWTQTSGRKLIEIPGAPSFSIEDVIKDCVQAFEFSCISAAIEEATKLATRCDFFIDFAEPWRKAKSAASIDKAELEGTLYSCCEVLRIIAILVSPVLPRAAHGIFDQLNWKMELSGKEERFSLKDAQWGGLPDRHVVGKPVPLFPRIEIT